MSYNLRIIQEYFQPKIGRRVRIFSLGRKNNILIKKKTVSLQTLKSLQIYLLTKNRKKTFRRIFSYKFGCRKKPLSDFLASRSSPSKTVNTALGSQLKHKLKLYAELKDSGFLETL